MSPASEDRRRGIPVAMIYVGIPAYLIVAGFSIRDIHRSHSSAVAAVGVAAVVVFSVLFLWLALGRPRDAEQSSLGAIVVMAVLAAGLALLGSTTVVYLPAVAAMAAETLAPRVSVPFIVAASAGAALYSIGHGFALQDTVTQPVIVLMVGLFTFGVRRLGDTNHELLAAREEVARLAVANERLRFARDLHDLLGHTLTVIRAKSELAGRVAAVDLERAVREMYEVEAVARQALGEVRETVTGYRRPTLSSEIANARRALESAGIEATVTTGRFELSSAIDETFGWVLREAVTNVIRHSGAATCRIETACDDGVVALEVADDGQASSTGPGEGLTGARERMAMVGGTLELGSGSGGGFRVVARVPGTA